MILVEVNRQDLEYVRGRLKGMEDKAPKALKEALNKTAKEARKRLAQKAQERYTVKNAGFNAHAKIQNATLSNLTAVIKVKGRPLTMPRFHITNPKSGVRAENIKGSGLKRLVDSAGHKAFIGTGKDSGAKLVLQRRGKYRFPLRSFYGPGVAKMLEKVYAGGQITDSGLKAEIERMYHENVEASIRKALNSK